MTSEQLDPSTARTLKLLKLGVTGACAEGSGEARRARGLSSKMEGMYGARSTARKVRTRCKDQTAE